MLSRRELLATFLGAPFVFAACRDVQTPSRFPEGEIVGYKARQDRTAEVTNIMEPISDKDESEGWGFQTLNLVDSTPSRPTFNKPLVRFS